MLARIRKSIEEKDQGFTLIELLVVVVIIGILAAIAIPTFLNQRQKAWEKAALSDLRNAAVVNEEYFSDNGTYPNTAALTPLLKPSNDVTVTVKSASTTAYCLDAVHGKLTPGTFMLNSVEGKAKAGACP